jgi:hypothetical protein
MLQDRECAGVKKRAGGKGERAFDRVGGDGERRDIGEGDRLLDGASSEGLEPLSLGGASVRAGCRGRRDPPARARSVRAAQRAP